MKKLLQASFLTVLLAGCAQTSIDPNISQMNNVTLKDIGYGQSAIDTYTVSKNQKAGIDDLKICIASSISNAGVTLNDNAGSYFGSYSGAYYQKSNTTSVSGGNTILAESKTRIVATGIGEYISDGLIPVTRYVRYIVTVVPINKTVKYSFTKIEQASKETGAMTNIGFMRVGAWSGADPIKVIKTLDNEVDKINNCLNNE